MNDSSEPEQSQRFDLQERLGSGGMGVVYAAYDRLREEKVALKILHHTSDASALYRFKKEFRTLADVAHPNLVSLYELIAEDEQWFFTMEIVAGQSFFEYVRPFVGDGEIDVADGSLLSDPPFEWDSEGLLIGGQLDQERLREALRQLVEGVQALHDAGKLHRDLKPSNVMVTERGRLVILDFGLATELAPDRQTVDSGLAGTVAYMAPEQAKSEGATAATDWYAVGVILFQALTGRLPFTGSLYDVLVGKQEKNAPSPSEVAAGLPPDLVELCERLLALDPELRPAGLEILELFGEQPQDMTTSAIALVQEKLLVGRATALAMLRDAYRCTALGQATAVYIHGPSGMGKTSLIDYFLESLTRRGDATVLRGRCYEREMVPYKALDGVIDSLSQYLASLDEREVVGLLPRDVHALLRLFPVLRRIYPMSRAPRQRRDSPDLLTLRRRAFEALRELLGRIAARRPLVLFIDDLQWADADSTALLDDLLRPPDPPPLLVLASFRSEEIEQKAFLRELLAATGTEACRQVMVAALTEAQVRELATALLDEGDLSEPVLEAIVKEAQGSPFLVEQLARFVQVNRDALRTGLTLVEMLEERMRQLPVAARPLLLTMAAANRPLDAAVAYEAAGEDGDERSLVASLRAAHFVRSSGSAQRLELYHDRIRDALATLLGVLDLKHIHRRLAETLERRGAGDPEALFEHYLEAGDEAAAGRQAVRAAKKAFAALAFDPAARFYRRALEMMPVRGDERIELTRGLALSLANAGRSSESAAVYLELAEGAAIHALEARCRAAEQYLLGGYVEKGLAVAGGVLAAVGLKMPSGPRQALFSLLRNRLRLRLRGLKFEERAAADIPDQDLVRIDTCWAVANGLSLADTVRGTDFQTRHLLLALAAGEPYRVARALAMEGSFMATTGVLKRAQELQKHAMALAHKVDSPHAVGLATMQIGLIAYFNGQWREAAEALDQAAGIFNDRCSGVVWEVTMCRRFSLGSLMYLGEIAELQHRVPVHLAEAKERGNIFLADTARARLNIVWLAADDPETGRRMLSEGQSAEPRRGFTVSRYNQLLARVQADLYCDDARAAQQRLRKNWPELEKSLLLRVHLVRVEALQARARAALAIAAGGGEVKSLLRLACKAAAKIDADRRPWAEPLAALLRAGVAAVKRDRAGCLASLNAAAEGFDAAEMALYAAVAHRRLGEVMANDDGRQLVAAADEWMRQQKIKNPVRMTATMAPGFPAA